MEVGAKIMEVREGLGHCGRGGGALERCAWREAGGGRGGGALERCAWREAGGGRGLRSQRGGVVVAAEVLGPREAGLWERRGCGGGRGVAVTEVVA